MRVITGTARGHILKSYKGLKVRPTLDRVREAVFSVLGSTVMESCFLDLFAGTGAVGIEALSRGARVCYFNDKNKKMGDLINENLVHCKLRAEAKVFNLDAMALIPYLQRHEPDLRFDIIYLDPPYEGDLYAPVLELLQKSTLLHQHTFLVAETSSRKEMPERIETVELRKMSQYGDTKIWYYQNI